MVVFEEKLDAQLLEKVSVERFAQFTEHVFVTEVIGCRPIVVQPARQGDDGIGDAVGHAQLVLAHLEFLMRERCLDELFVEAGFEHAAHLVSNDLGQVASCVFGGHVDLNDGERLLHGVCDERIHVVCDAFVEQCALERRLVTSEQGVE